MTYAHVYKKFISEDDIIYFDNLITGGSRSMTGKFSRCPHLYRMHDEKDASYFLFCFVFLMTERNDGF